MTSVNARIRLLLVDDEIGRLFGKLGDDDVLMIVSDHGFARLHVATHLRIVVIRFRFLFRPGAATLALACGGDETTVETEDGLPSVHFEHTVAMTDNGPLVLTEGVGVRV